MKYTNLALDLVFRCYSQIGKDRIIAALFWMDFIFYMHFLKETFIIKAKR